MYTAQCTVSLNQSHYNLKILYPYFSNSFPPHGDQYFSPLFFQDLIHLDKWKCQHSAEPNKIGGHCQVWNCIYFFRHMNYISCFRHPSQSLSKRWRVTRFSRFFHTVIQFNLGSLIRNEKVFLRIRL